MQRKRFIGGVEQYGITIAQYESMVEAQGNRCGICEREPDPNGRFATSRLHIDHSHKTGKVRALLCNRCNAGLGKFIDDPVLLVAAAAYLLQHEGITSFTSE
ncbi:MAG: endonuclease VII domain-containing protein [Propionibacteriales bacterium]|nr:endonuclease VII domain-containing protein [Propionibacteriales bacterium]